MMTDIIVSRQLDSVDGFDIQVDMLPDRDSKPEHQCYSAAHIAAFHNGDWRFVGVAVTASYGGVELGLDAVWAFEYGELPGIGDANPLKDGPGFIVDDVQQPDTFANGSGADMVSNAVQQAKRNLLDGHRIEQTAKVYLTLAGDGSGWEVANPTFLTDPDGKPWPLAGLDSGATPYESDCDCEEPERCALAHKWVNENMPLPTPLRLIGMLALAAVE